MRACERGGSQLLEDAVFSDVRISVCVGESRQDEMDCLIRFDDDGDGDESGTRMRQCVLCSRVGSGANNRDVGDVK